MPITPSYPGIYIQELPSNAHTITASPTNVAVFVGYTHPFKTNQFDMAIELFSFTDYEREFGGLFHSGDVPTDVAYAVYQFFLNGGTNAYVVGLRPNFTPAAPAAGGAVPVHVPAPAAASTQSTPDKPPIVFTARVLPDADHALSLQITNLQAGDKTAPAVLDTADVVITYGSQSETYRKVSLSAGGIVNLGTSKNPSYAAKNPNFIANRIGTSDNPVSALVTVPATDPPPAPAPGAPAPAPGTPPPAPPNYPAAFTPLDANAPVKQQAKLDFPPAIDPKATFAPSDADFLPVFEQDSSLDKLPIFNLMILPGITEPAVLAEALSFCERKQAFLIMDPPQDDIANQTGGTWIGSTIDDGTVQKSPNGALYFPYLKSPDPLTGSNLELPPSGFVAGVYCRTDDNRGVWKAPAGLETVITNTVGVVDTGMMNDMRQGTLNPLGVNCLRQFPGIGTVVYGARTLTTENAAFEQWRYVPVRRMALFLEQTLYRNLGWVVFEPNDEPLWVAIRTTIEAFMLSLFHQGAFQGNTPSKAFQVKCDADTTTQTDIDNGVVNIIVAFAPLKPAEFVIVKIAQLAGQTQA